MLGKIVKLQNTELGIFPKMWVAYGIPAARLSDLVVQGFSKVLGYIAIIIVSATVMGKVMEETGATYVDHRTIAASPHPPAFE